MAKGNKWLKLMKKAFVSSKGSRKSRDKVHSTEDLLVNDGKAMSGSDTNPSDDEQQRTKDVAASVAAAAAAEAAATPAEAAAEAERLTSATAAAAATGSWTSPPSPLAPAKAPPAPSHGNSREELAAIKIQTAYRVIMARRKLKTQKALARLKSMLHGQATRKQTSKAMRCMQSYAKMQSQVRGQRARMTELEIQRKQHLEARKAEAEGDSLSNEDWDDTVWSKEQIRAKNQTKHEAAVKRERTLAYAFSHQLWRSYPKDSTLIANNDDVEKPNWSWSWLEQWMSTRPWESLQDAKPAKVDNRSMKWSVNKSPPPPNRKHSPATKLVESPQKVASPTRKSSENQQKLPSPNRSLIRKPSPIHTISPKAPVITQNDDDNYATSPARSVESTTPNLTVLNGGSNSFSISGTARTPTKVRGGSHGYPVFQASPEQDNLTAVKKRLLLANAAHGRIPHNSPARSPSLPYKSPKRLP